MSLPIPYLSPILAKLAKEDRPNDDTVCPTCPASVWIRSARGLRCFCQLLRQFTWGPGTEPVIDCDGKEAALTKLASKGLD